MSDLLLFNTCVDYNVLCRAFQSVIVSVAVTGILPMINAFGILHVYIAIAALAWLAFGYASLAWFHLALVLIVIQADMGNHTIWRSHASLRRHRLLKRHEQLILLRTLMSPSTPNARNNERLTDDLTPQRHLQA